MILVTISDWKGVSSYSSVSTLPFLFSDRSGSAVKAFSNFSPPGFENISNRLLLKTFGKLNKETDASVESPWIVFGGSMISSSEKFPLLK